MVSSCSLPQRHTQQKTYTWNCLISMACNGQSPYLTEWNTAHSWYDLEMESTNQVQLVHFTHFSVTVTLKSYNHDPMTGHCSPALTHRALQDWATQMINTYTSSHAISLQQLKMQCAALLPHWKKPNHCAAVCGQTHGNSSSHPDAAPLHFHNQGNGLHMCCSLHRLTQSWLRKCCRPLCTLPDSSRPLPMRPPGITQQWPLS